MARIYLIRHGDTQKIEDDIVLNEKGFFEAKAVAKKLNSITFSHVFSSELTRAKQTAEEFTADFKKRPELNEIYRVLIGGPVREGTPEDRAEKDKARTDKIWKELCSLEGNIAVFCHGNIIRYFLCKALEVKPTNIWNTLVINNGSISIVENEVQAINLIEHLPGKLFSRKDGDPHYNP